MLISNSLNRFLKNAPKKVTSKTSLTEANYLLLAYASYEGHPDSNYRPKSRSMLTTRKGLTVWR
jgi:hypothetical protein